MGNMRNIIIGSMGLFLALFLLCSCDGFLTYHGWKDSEEAHSLILFENKSDKELFVGYCFPYVDYTYSYMLCLWFSKGDYRSFIKPDEVSEKALKQTPYEWGKHHYWETEFLTEDSVCILIADAVRVRQRMQEGKEFGDYPYDYEDWPEEALDSPLLAVYTLTQDDLNALDWRLSFPPDVTMRPESIIQKQ